MLNHQDNARSCNTGFGRLSFEMDGIRRPLQILKSEKGYYLGTFDDEGPVSRESNEYWLTQEIAADAFKSGNWTQKESA